MTGEAAQRPLLDRPWRPPTPACLRLRSQPPARAQHREALKAVSLLVNRVQLFLFLGVCGGEGQIFPPERFLPLFVPAAFAVSCSWTFLEFFVFFFSSR